MRGLKAYLIDKLKLKVNESKSAVAPPAERKFLGFTFRLTTRVWRVIAPQSAGRFKEKVRELTRRSRGISLERMVAELRRYLTGWLGYFGFSEWPSVLRDLEGWLRRRLRCFLWKRWKVSPARFRELRGRGVGPDLAAQTVGSPHGPWRLSCSPALNMALPNRFFDELGLPSLVRKPIN